MYAEEVNYWKTGQSSPDTWLERAKKEIREVGGQIVGEGFISEELTGRSSYLLAFSLGNDRFKLLWPVLESKSGNIRAARIQAATALCHEVKAACVKVKFLGVRAAFFAYLILSTGQTAAQAGTEELNCLLPRLLSSTDVDIKYPNG